MVDFDNLVERALAEYPLYERIVEYKIDGMPNVEIQESLEKLSEGRTTIVVAHRLSSIKGADEIIVITQDGAVERGTHNELIENDGIYAGLYKYQFRSLTE